jgi:hypothetical protein
MQPLELAAGPPLWIDWILAIVMWFCGGLIAYASVESQRPALGHYLLLMRALAVSWLFFAGRLTFVLMEIGALGIDWWSMLALFCIAVCSLGLSFERVHIDSLTSDWPDDYPGPRQ